MKRWLVVLLLVLTVVGAAPPVMADVGGPRTPVQEQPAPTSNPANMGLVPPSQVKRAVQPTWERYGISYYSFDEDYGITGSWALPILGLANLLMLLTALVTKWAIWLMETAFSMKLLTDLLPALDAILRSMTDSFWSSRLVQLGVICAGAWALWMGIVLRRTGHMLAGLVIVALALAVGPNLGGKSGMSWYLQTVNDVSTEISGIILTGSTDREVQDWAASDSFVGAGERIWTTYVVSPWATGAFNGDVETAKKYSASGVMGGRLLEAKTETERRDVYFSSTKEVKKADFTWWQKAGTSGSRLLVALVALVMALVFCIVVAAMAAGVLICQMAALGLAGLGPVVLLVCLFTPATAGYRLSVWAQYTFGSLAIKIGLAALLTLLLSFSSALAGLTEHYHWAFVAFLQIILIVVLALLWKVMLRIFGTVPAGVQGLMQRVRRSRGTAESEEVGAGVGVRSRIRAWRERRQAVATLNQRLTNDRERAAHTGRVTPLLKKVDQRMKQGAKRPWTESEIRAEVARNRDLRTTGADPLAIAATGTDGEYQARVAAVRAQNVDTMRRIGAMKRYHRPRVKHQAWERGPVGRMAKGAQRVGAPVARQAQRLAAPLVEQVGQVTAPVIEDMKRLTAPYTEAAHLIATPILNQVKEAAAPVTERAKRWTGPVRQRLHKWSLERAARAAEVPSIIPPRPSRTRPPGRRTQPQLAPSQLGQPKVTSQVPAQQPQRVQKPEATMAPVTSSTGGAQAQPATRQRTLRGAKVKTLRQQVQSTKGKQT